MKTLYIECNMGAAGDMLMAALYELLSDEQKRQFVEKMNGLGLPGVKVAPCRKTTCGIAGTHMEVTVHGEEEREPDTPHGHEHLHAHEHGHHHASPGHIAALIDGLPLTERVREHARRVYDLIAEAEAKAHGCPAGDVHFHEVGALDAVADVAGVCYALEMLRPDRILASPVHVGSGTMYGGQVRGELCTPTGAALLVHFAQHFGDMPVMRGTSVGIGVGTKEFDRANCVRVFLGETEEGADGSIAELVCNIDDMTPEALAYAQKRLLDLGALDAYTTAGTMKKGRPGWELTVLCHADRVDRTAKDILRETTTNGVRVRLCRKYFLRPGSETVETLYGAVRVKTAERSGIMHVKPEYEDAAAAAEKAGVPYREVCEETMRAYRAGKRKGQTDNE